MDSKWTDAGKVLALKSDQKLLGLNNVGAGAPGSPEEGEGWYDSTNNIMGWYTGSSWYSGLKASSITIADDGWIGLSSTTGRLVFDDQATDEAVFAACNVGIGAGTPVSLLELYDASAHPVITISAAHATDYDPQIQFRTDASPTTKFSLGVDGADDKFKINSDSGIGGSTEFVIDTSGNIGFGTSSPGSLFEIASSTPYVRIHNTTHENTAGGREGRIVFRGEQLGGEETTLIIIEGRHEGTGDDQKGQLLWYVNDGDDVDSPLQRMALDSAGLLALYDSTGDKIASIGTDADQDGAIALFNSAGTIKTELRSDGSDNYMINGNFGLGTSSPGALFEIASSAPYIRIHNTTHEDTNKGRKGRIIFRGEQSGGSESTLAYIEGSHEGTGNDEKGRLLFYVNDGNDGDTPLQRMQLDSAGLLAVYDSTGDKIASIGTDADQDGAIALFNSSGTIKAEFRTDGSDSYLVEGNFGVGQSSPAAKIEAEVADEANIPGLLIDQNDVTNNPYGIEIQNAGTGHSIYDDSTAHLTAAGVWTDNPSCYEDKENLTELSSYSEYLTKFKRMKLFNYQKKIEIYGKKKEGKYPKEKRNPNSKYYVGYVLDDPDTPEEIIERDKNGNISGIAAVHNCNFIFAVMKEMLAKIEHLENIVAT